MVIPSTRALAAALYLTRQRNLCPLVLRESSVQCQAARRLIAGLFACRNDFLWQWIHLPIPSLGSRGSFGDPTRRRRGSFLILPNGCWVHAKYRRIRRGMFPYQTG